MPKQQWWLGFLGVLSLMVGCSSPNPNVRARRLPDGHIEVQGPLAGPFKTQEELAASACDLMTRQPGASNGFNGSEYCALYYYSQEGNGFFLSYLSDIKSKLDGAVKSCVLPGALDDKQHGGVVILGGGHTHPHSRRFSRNDLSAAARWYPTRVVDKTTGRAWNRALMMFYREASGECRAFRYDNVTYVVSALRGGRWVDIGRVNNDAGDIEMFPGMDWLP